MDIDFSPEKSLFSLPIVRWCAGGSAILAIAVSLTIFYNLRYYPFDFSGDGFNRFAEFYKVPAALLAIGFTLVGLCAANHRSEQTKKQIERTSSQIALTNNQITLTREQNIFANHYKHLEEFEKFLKKLHHNEVTYLANRKEWFSNNKLFAGLAKSALIGPHMDIERYRDIYGDIYPKSKAGDFDCSPIYQERLSSFILEILEIHSEMLTKNSILLSQNMIKIYETTKNFKDINHINIPYETTNRVTISNKKIDIPRSDFKFLFIDASEAALLIIKILSFDIDYKKPEEFQKLLSLNDPAALPSMSTEEYDERSSVFRTKGVTPENLFQ